MLAKHQDWYWSSWNAYLLQGVKGQMPKAGAAAKVNIDIEGERQILL